MVGFRDLVGVGIAPVSKKLLLKHDLEGGNFKTHEPRNPSDSRKYAGMAFFSADKFGTTIAIIILPQYIDLTVRP